MKLEEIKAIARKHNITPGRARKVDLVRAIQRAEGNQPCFASGIAAECGQGVCLWREDCA